ncbi:MULTISPECIES: ester cyclase [Brevibacillus]|uniref:ester cyclase n=1 Tax=Brevibacillus TaxID=55080 RepID=UPI001EDAD536|nr:MULTISPECIES: ester cyclase [Brevibacillus]MCM3146348.1 ester cyclase [Brevibacillus sp. MER 51]UKK96433.1 ester cyclase [Brevibacillus brevis]
MIPRTKRMSSIAGIAVIFGTMLFTTACATDSKTSAYDNQTAVLSAKTDVQLLKDLPQPVSMTIDSSLDSTKATEMVQAAQRFYGFWNTGNEELISQTVSPSFIDNTLPKGRPQGPDGLLFASRNFRKAVPDLQCKIEDLLVVGDKVTARLSFTGTSKGEFMGKPLTGKPIQFMAIDVLRIKDGKLVEDWHLEDNLTFMQQIGVVAEN